MSARSSVRVFPNGIAWSGLRWAIAICLAFALTQFGTHTNAGHRDHATVAADGQMVVEDTSGGVTIEVEADDAMSDDVDHVPYPVHEPARRGLSSRADAQRTLRGRRPSAPDLRPPSPSDR